MKTPTFDKEPKKASFSEALYLSFKFGKSDTTDGVRSCSVVIPGLRALNIIAAAGVDQ